MLAVGLAWGMGYLQARETERREQRPTQYAQSAKEDAQSACVNAAPERVVECVYDKIEAGREQAKAEQDLSAQQRAASSGLASAVISAVTLLVSVAGLWALLRTIRQGDAGLAAAVDANGITRDSMETDQRAWLDVNLVDGSDSLQWESERCRYLAPIRIENLGNTPALDITVHTEIYFGGDSPIAITKFRDRVLNGPGTTHPLNLHKGSHEDRLIDARRGSVGLLNAIIGDETIASLFLAVRYHTVFDANSRDFQITVKGYDLTNTMTGGLRRFDKFISRPELNVEPNMIHPGYVT